VTRWLFDVHYLFLSAYVLVCVLVCLICFPGVTFLAPSLGISTHVKLWIYWIIVLFPSPRASPKIPPTTGCVCRPSFHFPDKQTQSLRFPSPFPGMDLSHERLFTPRVHVVERMEIMPTLCSEHGATHVLWNDCGKLSCLFKRTETCKKHNSSHSRPTKASQRLIKYLGLGLTASTSEVRSDSFAFDMVPCPVPCHNRRISPSPCITYCSDLSPKCKKEWVTYFGTCCGPYYRECRGTW
jgi:hypothetical protein